MKPLLILSLTGLLITGTTTALADEASIRALVAKKAAIITNMHDRATRAIVQVAQDPAFPSYFEAAHLGQHDHAHDAKVRIDHISLATQDKFHVEEMCLIDINGAEVSRIVQNQIAYDLSTEEASAAFFAPSFARPVRSTYIAPLYMSPDVSRWVMAYTTPIEVDGEKVAILHYEHGLDAYQNALNRETLADGTHVVAVDSNGLIVADSRRDIAIEMVGEDEEITSYFEPFALGELALEDIKAALGEDGVGTLTLDGKDHAVAYKAVADWTIVGVQKLYFLNRAAKRGVECACGHTDKGSAAGAAVRGSSLGPDFSGRVCGLPCCAGKRGENRVSRSYASADGAVASAAPAGRN